MGNKISTDKLISFLNSKQNAIPNELYDYVKTIKLYDLVVNGDKENISKANIILDIFKISYCTIPNNTNEVIVFMKNKPQHNKELFKFKNEIIIEKIVVGNKHCVSENDILLLEQSKELNKSQLLYYISTSRKIPIKENSSYHIDTREPFNSTADYTNSALLKLSKQFSKHNTELIANANIESGLIIKTTECSDGSLSPNLKFNYFDKSDVVFKDLLTNSTYDQLTTAINHLQQIIPNTNNLIFIANQTKHHYSAPFDTQHRRINMIFYGGQGTGKNTIINIICDLFNSTKNNYTFSKNNNFNDDLKGTSAVVFNEYKKNSDGGDFIKKYFESEYYDYNAKYKNIIRYPVYAISICSLNPNDKNNKVEDLVESQDNRNFLIEMEQRMTEEEDCPFSKAFSFLQNKSNYQIIQTSLICIALHHPLSINEMEQITRETTQKTNIEKINFYDLWNLLIEILETENEVAIQKKIFQKYFRNNKELLVKNSKNINQLFDLSLKQVSKKSRCRKYIKDTTEGLQASEVGKKLNDCYIFEKELIEKINTDFDNADAVNELTDSNVTAKVNIEKKDVFDLQNKLNDFLNQRKKNFKNVDD